MTDYREFDQDQEQPSAFDAGSQQPNLQDQADSQSSTEEGSVKDRIYHYGKYGEEKIPDSTYTGQYSAPEKQNSYQETQPNGFSYQRYYQQQVPQQPAAPQFDYSRYQQPTVPSDQQPNGKKPKKRRSTGLIVTVTALSTAIIMLAVYFGSNLLFFQNKMDTGVESSTSQTQSSAAQQPAENAFDLNSVPETSTSTSTGEELTGAQVAAKLKPSVVCIQNYQQDTTLTPSGEGSGIIFSEDGYILTNAHVVSSATTLKVILSDGGTYDAELIGSDTTTDLAVIKIDATGLTPAEFGDSSQLQQGDTVMAIGNPGGMAFNSSVSQGVVSAVDRPITSDVGYTMKCIQTDAAINPGNSGGPLVNMYGQVVGINSSKIVAAGYEGLGFAISINEAQSIVSDLKAYGYVTGRVYLGIQCQMVNSMISQMYGMPVGVYIEGFSTTFMQDNGFQRGDILVEADETALTDTSILTNKLMEKSPGDTITSVSYTHLTLPTILRV